jgi:sRNA-binding carbon storage regulator CsrA
MFVLTMHPGDVTMIDEIAVNIGETAADHVRVTVNAPSSSCVKLMPDDIVVSPRITVCRSATQQIHIDDDVQVWVIKLHPNRARIGISAPRHRQITRVRVITDDSSAM